MSAATGRTRRGSCAPPAQRGDDLQLVGGHALGMPEFWTIAGQAGTGTIFTGRRDTGLGAATAGAIDALRAHGVEPVPGSLAAYAASRFGPRPSSARAAPHPRG